jgi:hypothetical protein
MKGLRYFGFAQYKLPRIDAMKVERTRACVATGDAMKNCSWYLIKNYFRSKIEIR